MSEAQKVTLATITARTEEYAERRVALIACVNSIRAAQRAVIEEHSGELRRLVASTAAGRDALFDELVARPDLFAKPRTRAVNGVTVGYRKLPGTVTFENADEVMAAIRERHGARAADLIKTKHELSRSALRVCEADLLSDIGVAIGEDGDEPVIKAARSDIDKIVALMISEMDDVTD